jgi:hypothetical protein
MHCPWFSLPRWLALLSVSVVLAPTSVRAQPAPSIDSELQRLTSRQLDARREAFYSLIAPYNSSGRADLAVAGLLAAHSKQADQIKVALFSALERESAFSASFEERGEALPEALVDYCYDLVRAVGSLRDRRALKSLLAAESTGAGVDPDFVADLCPDAIDAIIDQWHQPDRYFEGIQLHIPGRAIVALGECLKRPASIGSRPDAVAKIRAVLLAVVDSADPGYRRAAVEGLFPLRNDAEVRAKLELVAGSDPFLGPIRRNESQPRFLIRDVAARILKTPEGDKSWYVIKTAETQQCRVQELSDPVVGELYLGPFPKEEDTKASMCNHLDPSAQNPSLCWRVAPTNACTR